MGTRGARFALPVAMLLAIAPAPVMAQRAVVHLHNGGRIYGELIEVQPGQQVRLKTSDGEVRVVPWTEVERVEEQAAPAPAPASAPASPAPAAPAPVVAAPPPAPAPPAPAMASPAMASPALEHPQVRQLPIAEPVPAPPRSDARERSRQLNLAVLGVLGVGGELGGDLEITTSTESDTRQLNDSNLRPGFGAGLQLDFPLHAHFSIGLLARLYSFRPQSSDESALFVDFALTPRARFPFALGEHWGAAYVQLAVGGGVVDLPDGEDSVVTDTVEVRTIWESTDPSLLVGGNVGVQLMLSELAGFVIEIGWHHRFFGREAVFEATSTAQTQRLDVDVSFEGGQVMLSGGPLFAF